MKKLWILLLVFATLPGWARRGGDDVGNGGGLAEKNFLIAYSNLESYTKICLDLDACRLDDEQKRVLSAIIQSMPQQRRIEEQIQFSSEKRNPGFFVLDGQVKVAKTGSTVGAPIYVNVDLIYSKNKFGEIVALSIPEATAILIHELGHHVSSLSHAELDLLGVRVSLFLQNRIQTTPLLPWNQQISATIVQGSQLESFPQVLLNVGETVKDLSAEFEDSVYCPVFNVPIPFLPFPDLQFGKQKPRGVLFHNVHWEKASRKEGEPGKFSIRGNLTHICPSGSGLFTGVNSFRARIRFETVPGPTGEPQLVPDSTDVKQSYEPWYKLIRLSF